MITKEKILEIARNKGIFTTQDIVDHFDVSRQYASRVLSELVAGGSLLKCGSTRSARYMTEQYAEGHPEMFSSMYFVKTFANRNIEEYQVLVEIEKKFPLLGRIPENVKSIFTYAFTEMLNNAIEHSKSTKITVKVMGEKEMVSFMIHDGGIGVFRNVMRQRRLGSEVEAIQDLLKGKTTTMPHAHSGEGIFFTSKVGDMFVLASYGRELRIDNRVPAAIRMDRIRQKRGTEVVFSINVHSRKHLNDVFNTYTSAAQGEYGFDKTEIQVRLYALGGVHISRSQARRILAGLEKFRTIVFDFDQVPLVGQAFADEIFRVFQGRHPHIRLETVHMNDAVRFMVKRAQGNKQY